MNSTFFKVFLIAIIAVSLIGISKFSDPCSDILGLGKSNGCEFSSDVIGPTADEPMTIAIMVFFLIGLVALYKLVSLYRNKK